MHGNTGMAKLDILCGSALDVMLCLAFLAVAIQVLLTSEILQEGGTRRSPRANVRHRLLFYYLLSLCLLLVGMGRAIAALQLSSMPGGPGTIAELLPPVFALAASISSIGAASLLALAAPRLAQLGEAQSGAARADLESGIPKVPLVTSPSPTLGLASPTKGLASAGARPGSPQGGGSPGREWSRLDENLRPTADALQLNSKQVMLLIAALCELSKNRAHWSRKPEETWGKFLQALHEILTESKSRPMLPAEAWYEVSRWYSSLSDSRLTQLLRAAMVFHGCPKPKEALQLANLLWPKVPGAVKGSGAKADRVLSA
mmetsp:Transcript_40744/g.83623  ORF Transcript_40744/g.83623 Transcript_40744/m.83623 type:complete len:316 (+) Transcript_40744:43-990(+)|eukprot:s6730_g3.t1